MPRRSHLDFEYCATARKIGTRGCIGSGSKDHPECSDYDHCDECGRGLCKYVSISCDPLGSQPSLLCQDCYKSNRIVYIYGNGFEEGAAHSSEEAYASWLKEINN